MFCGGRGFDGRAAVFAGSAGLGFEFTEFADSAGLGLEFTGFAGCPDPGAEFIVFDGVAGFGEDAKLGRPPSPFDIPAAGGRGTGRLAGAGVAGAPAFAGFVGFVDTGRIPGCGGRGTLRAGVTGVEGCGCTAPTAGRAGSLALAAAGFGTAGPPVLTGCAAAAGIPGLGTCVFGAGESALAGCAAVAGALGCGCAAVAGAPGLTG